MTVEITGAASTNISWVAINWQPIDKQVRRLQMRIAKAIREGKYGKAKALQWLLTHSHSAKLLAVKRVSRNKGSKTPGIDGVVWNTARKKMEAVKLLKRRGYKPQALRRVYIPKKNGKLRPLGIPCMVDRGQQALHLLGLEPIAETNADNNAYGFRPKRSCADAIAQCFATLSRKQSSQWILEGDIKSCFDKIGHEWLENNVLMDKQILNKWLKAGYIDKGIFYHTEEGTPQGGLISPTLMLITLRGLEETARKVATHRSDKINVAIYADDFIITGASKELLEERVKPAVKEFLKVRGLQLSEEKTKITHIKDGFDFLGFNIRKYKCGKLLIKPAKQNVLRFLNNIRDVIRKNGGNTAYDLISNLNPKIKGWGNYYRHVVAKRTYNYVDFEITKAIFKWGRRRHPNKSKHWVIRKYFTITGINRWTFVGTKKLLKGKKSKILTSMRDTPIQRHNKIIGKANPYDPDYAEYFRKRKEEKYRNTWVDLPCTA
jgi:RNA-directed DNA polymerase